MIIFFYEEHKDNISYAIHLRTPAYLLKEKNYILIVLIEIRIKYESRTRFVYL